MGHITQKRIEVIATLSELVGYKSGIALSQQNIIDHLPQNKELLNGADDDMLRLHSSEYESLLTQLLFCIGNIPTSTPLYPGIGIYHKYCVNDPKIQRIWTDLMKLWAQMLHEISEEAARQNKPADLTPFFKEAANRFITPFVDSKIIDMLKDFIDEVALYFHTSLSMNIRREEWKNTLELVDLFKSESLETFYGSFFDQRFIDYLAMNFPSINQIHWRKFEGLTAEYFTRSGFYVEIGPGRNDDGIDIRIWPQKEDKHLAPATLIQCKRQKEKIEKVVVKALYADILDVGAQSGMIVTTSTLSPGAEKVCLVRAYPITQANYVTLKQWILTMRSPYTGVFMGE